MTFVSRVDFDSDEDYQEALLDDFENLDDEELYLLYSVTTDDNENNDDECPF